MKDWIQVFKVFFFLSVLEKNTKVIFKFGKQRAPEEDEAEETGDGVWRGHILCGSILTVSDVGSSPT